MKKTIRKGLGVGLKVASLTLASLGLITACGGGSSGGNDEKVGFSLGISDAPVDNAKEVVITIDRVTLRREGEDDLVFDTFDNSDEGIVDADTVQIDLLAYQGSSQFTILEGEEIPAGDYSDMLLEILDEDVELSYVKEVDDTIKPIKVPSNELKLGGFTVGTTAQQRFTIEFNLRKSMAYRPSPGKEEYNLKPRGVSLADNSATGNISGEIDLDTILADAQCAPEGHVVYLYAGNNLVGKLSDEFDPDVANNGAPEGAIVPFASTGIMLDDTTGTYHYEFGFIPEGTHTLAYACNTGETGDDPELYDGIMIPLPEDGLYLTDVTVVAAETVEQNFPLSPTALTLGIADAPVDDVDEVVITVDKITLKQEGNDDQLFDCFLVEATEGQVDDEGCPVSEVEGKVYVDLVTLNLLDFTGGEQFILLDDVEIAEGDYQDVWLDVFDEDLQYAYVNEQLPEGDAEQDPSFLKELKVPSGTLKLGGFSLSDTGAQLTIDFNLRKSMTYNPGPMRYILKPRGVTLVDNAGTGTIEGMVGETLAGNGVCAAEGAMQVAYLYAGEPEGALGDEYDPEANSEVTAAEPYASVVADADGMFKFGFVPAGTHTLALYCGTESDDPDKYDALTIPTVADSQLLVTVVEDLTTSCDLSSATACLPPEQTSAE